MSLATENWYFSMASGDIHFNGSFPPCKAVSVLKMIKIEPVIDSCHFLFQVLYKDQNLQFCKFPDDQPLYFEQRYLCGQNPLTKDIPEI